MSAPEAGARVITNGLFFRAGLSLWGAISIGAFGALIGLAWGAALGVDLIYAVVAIGVLAAIWGAIAFQLTPTGGIVLDNKATVNYAVIAVHGWMTAFIILIGLAVWIIRLLLVG